LFELFQKTRDEAEDSSNHVFAVKMSVGDKKNEMTEDRSNRTHDSKTPPYVMNPGHATQPSAEALSGNRRV